MKQISPPAENEARALLARHHAARMAEVLRRTGGLPNVRLALDAAAVVSPDDVAARRTLENVFRAAAVRPVVDAKPALQAVEQVARFLSAQAQQQYGALLPGQPFFRRIGAEVMDAARRSVGGARSRSSTPAHLAAGPVVAAAELAVRASSVVRSAAAAKIDAAEIDAAHPAADIFRTVAVVAAPVLDADNDLRAAGLALANASGLLFMPSTTEAAVGEIVDLARELSLVEFEPFQADVGFELIRHGDVLAPSSPAFGVDLEDPHALAAAASFLGDRYVSSVGAWRSDRDHPNRHYDLSHLPARVERPDPNAWNVVRRPSSEWHEMGVRMDAEASAILNPQVGERGID
jgi:hypothetical protein